MNYRSWRSLFLSCVVVSASVQVPALGAEWRYRPDLNARFQAGKVRLPTVSRHRDASSVQLAKDLSIVSVDKDGKTFTKDLTEADVLAYTTGEKGRTEAFAGTDADEGTFRKIIGEDTREQILTTTTMPYRAFGRIEVGCSGTLIGPRHVLTAAHCVYDDWSGKWYKELKFYPGQNGEDMPYGEQDWERVFAVRGWTEAGDTNYDIALIVLKEPIGMRTGWHAIGYDTKLDAATQVSVTGYPGDKPEGTQWGTSCPLMEANPEQLHYECDTYPGNSGSAVVGELAEGKTVIAVHTNGYPTYNRGTRMISAFYKHLVDWQLEN